MGQGARVFGTDYAAQVLGGDVTVTSNDAKKWYAVDSLITTRWESSGEDTDGNNINYDRDFQTNRTIDTIFIWRTNIENTGYYYWNGSSWIEITSSNATITKDSTGMYVHVKLNSPVTTQKVRIVGTDTITPNEEKYITLLYTFLEIGQFTYRPNFIPEYALKQNKFELDNGKNFVIDRGESFACDVEFKSYVHQGDITLAETLVSRKTPFFLWINGGDEDQFTYKFRPYRFENIYKMAVVDKERPQITKNYYRAGYNNRLPMIEVS